MSLNELESTLKTLGRVGTLIKDRGYRQIWRFEHADRAYYVKFYPRQSSGLKKFKHAIRGNPAMREFQRLQAMQKAGVAAPHAIAVLMGFRINDIFGDAVLLDAIEPSIQLDRYLNNLHLAGKRAPHHRQLVEGVRKLVHALGKAKLGHSDLHLGNFLIQNDKLFLLDGYAVRNDGLRMRDVMQLGHSAARYASTTDLQRGWDVLGSGGWMPRTNSMSPRIWNKFIARARGGNRYFGNIECGLVGSQQAGDLREGVAT